MRIPIRVPIKPHPEIKVRLLPPPEVIEAQLIDTEDEVRRLRAALEAIKRHQETVAPRAFHLSATWIIAAKALETTT